MPEKYELFLLLALIAEIIGTVSGFGSSILFVPIASLFFDLKSVLGITAIFHVFSNITKMVLFREGVNWNICLKLGIPAILFVLLGSWMTTFISTQWLEVGMNVMLVGLSIYLMLHFNKTLKQSNQNLYLGGVASGFLAGLVGTGGAIRGIVLAAFHLPKQVFIATSALIDFGVDSSRAVVYTLNGYFKQEHFLLIPFLIGISLIGTYLGKLILKRTSEARFRYIVLVVVSLTAAYQLVLLLWKK